MTYIGVRIVEFADKILTKLGMTSFGKALVYMAVLLAIIFGILMVITIISLKRKVAVNGGGNEGNARYTRVLGLLILAVSTIIPISAALPVNAIYRFFGYFVLDAVDAALMVLYIAGNGRRRAYLLYGITVILLTAVTSVFIKNHFFGSGYPYNFMYEPLYTQGTLTQYQVGSITGGFYYFIPTDAINLVTIGIYTGLTDPMEILYDSLFALVTVLALVLFLDRLGVKGSVLSAFLIFVPPLSFLIARVGALPYTSLAFLSLVLMIMGAPIMGTGMIYVLSSLDSIFAHPVGPITITATLLITYLALPLLKAQGREFVRARSIIGKALAAIMIMEFTYWVGVDIAIFLIMEKVHRTMDSLLRVTSTVISGNVSTLYNLSPVVAPGYSSPEVRVYAYIWALPVALSLVLVLILVLYGINRMNRLNTMSGVGLIMGFSAALSSILATALGYADYAAGEATGVYLLPVAYFLALIGSAVATGILLRGKSRVVLTAFLLLFMAFVLLGIYSPDWAPIENSSIFHVVAMVHPYYVSLESKQLSPILPHVKFYAEDGLPFGSQGKLPTAAILSDFSKCRLSTLIGVYINQVPKCILERGNTALATTQGYAIVTPLDG